MIDTWRFQMEKVETSLKSYADLLWYRKSGPNNVLMLVHVLSLGFIPLLLVTCCALVTGNIYYDKVDDQGHLKAWSGANRVVAFLFLIFSLLLIGVVVLTIAGF
jgi:hypothetical protein